MVNILASYYTFGDEYAKGTIEKYIKPEHRVVVIPFSFGEEQIKNSEEWDQAYDKESGKYYSEVVEPFEKLGIRRDNIMFLNYFRDNEDTMRMIIQKSQVVFLTGGDTEKAVERIREKDLIDEIRATEVVIGISAGAFMQMKEYYLSPESADEEFKYCDGIGLVDRDFYMEVHYENRDTENECIDRVLKEKHMDVYAVTDKGCIIIDGDNMITLGEVKVYRRTP